MHWSSQGFQSKITDAALLLLAVTIWLLLHGYHGLLGDAQLYAFQALAKIHPQLTHDLYLQNTSQDQFTVFSPVYAWFIQLFGLEPAARLLTLVFTIWFLGAAWTTARILTSREAAWLAIIFLLIVDGSYGGSGVFRFAEQFLTARLPAEALIATALACFLRGLKLLAAVTAAAALLVHPLIALPGLLLLICLRFPIRAGFLGAAACAIGALLIAFAALIIPWVTKLLPIMDWAWLNVVQERSQFLFLQLWSFRDWELNARPFFCLAFISLASQDIRVRRICLAAAIVGATGMIVALIASTIGPLALLVQGQAWRWVWIAVFVSALLLPATVMQIWSDKKCGPLCAVLLILGLTLPASNGVACVSLAIIFWLIRSRNSTLQVSFLRWVFLALLVAVAAWLSVKSWEVIWPAIGKSREVPAVQVRDIFALKIPAVLVASFFWWRLRNWPGVRSAALLSAGLLALSIFVFPAAFKQNRVLASATDISEFRDWQTIIPPSSTVLAIPSRDVGTFVWFTLQRPNYLALDQSAGVVFSRTTALEVQRRSQVLLPVMDPDWKIWSKLRAPFSSKQKADATSRPLTSANLSRICADPRLGYVLSPERLGFDALAHRDAGPWLGWELYDCRKVRTWESDK
jgi:hypothetical protein